MLEKIGKQSVMLGRGGQVDGAERGYISAIELVPTSTITPDRQMRPSSAESFLESDYWNGICWIIGLIGLVIGISALILALILFLFLLTLKQLQSIDDKLSLRNKTIKINIRVINKPLFFGSQVINLNRNTDVEFLVKESQAFHNNNYQTQIIVSGNDCSRIPLLLTS